MSLQTCLADQHQALLDFEQLLVEENTLLLRSFEPQELAQITLRKYQLVERIEQLDQARAQLLQARELENNLQGLRYAAEEDELEQELEPRKVDLTKQEVRGQRLRPDGRIERRHAQEKCDGRQD